MKITLRDMMIGLMLILSITSVCAASKRSQSKPMNQFSFAIAPIVTGDSETADALRETIVAFWQDYLRMNTPKYLNHFTPDAIRLSGRAGARQAGRAALQAGLLAEWEAFERLQNRIAEQMTVERAEFHLAGHVATALYWLAVKGGALWEYTDLGLVFQAFVKQDGRWQVAHHTDTWSLDYDVDAQQPGSGATVDFAFAYPVNDLARAIKFYTPLLGAPEEVTSQRAVFNLKGGRLILETSTWGGRAQVRKNLPNGYALFVVADGDSTAARIAQVSEIGAPQKMGADLYRVGMEVDKNLSSFGKKSSTPTPTRSRR